MQEAERFPGDSTQRNSSSTKPTHPSGGIQNLVASPGRSNVGDGDNAADMWISSPRQMDKDALDSLHHVSLPWYRAFCWLFPFRSLSHFSMHFWFMLIRSCVVSWLDFAISHYSSLLCIRSWLRKPLVFAPILYLGIGLSGLFVKPQFWTVFVMGVSSSICAIVCKGSEKHIHEFSPSWECSYRGICLQGLKVLDGFSLL